jgi:DNA repair exonuclease SbcCD ATPase subunit
MEVNNKKKDNKEDLVKQYIKNNKILEENKKFIYKNKKKSKKNNKKSNNKINEQKINNYQLENKDQYKKNNEIIDLNNQIDIQLRNIEVSLKDKQNTILTNTVCIERNKGQINQYQQNIKERKNLIIQLQEEVVNLTHWQLYLEMVGKNGISKMVLRKTLPIINAHLTRLLSDVCDFNIEITINEKNEVMFYLIKDGVKSDLTSGSGFERTASALALRAVLGNISTLPKTNILILDEILGRVAKENYDNMRTLYDKILDNYDAIIQISHLSEIKDWHDRHIVVTKENNISKIKLH